MSQAQVRLIWIPRAWQTLTTFSLSQSTLPFESVKKFYLIMQKISDWTHIGYLGIYQAQGGKGMSTKNWLKFLLISDVQVRNLWESPLRRPPPNAMISTDYSHRFPIALRHLRPAVSAIFEKLVSAFHIVYNWLGLKWAKRICEFLAIWVHDESKMRLIEPKEILLSSRRGNKKAAKSVQIISLRRICENDGGKQKLERQLYDLTWHTSAH